MYLLGYWKLSRIWNPRSAKKLCNWHKSAKTNLFRSLLVQSGSKSRQLKFTFFLFFKTTYTVKRIMELTQRFLYVICAHLYNSNYKHMRWPDSFELFSRSETECPSEEGDGDSHENDKEEDTAQAQEQDVVGAPLLWNKQNRRWVIGFLY